MNKITKIFTTILLTLTTTTAIGQLAPGGLKVNDLAPGFESIDQNGKRIVLKEQLEKGPVVLVFYRGEWCPYCNKQLKQLEDSLSVITKRGATVIAISPEK